MFACSVLRKAKFNLYLRFVLCFLFLHSGIVQAQPKVEDLLRHVDNLWRGTSSHTLMTMTVTTAHYSRAIELEGWSQGDDDALIVIKSPKKDRGIATLKSAKNVWNYLPKINRVTKVPSSMMSGSWMGSHFTNDDLVKESSYREDYIGELSFDGIRKGVDVYELSLIPKENAPVVWGRVELTIEQQDYLPLEVRYFDEANQIKRVMRFENPKEINGKVIPLTLTLQPTDKPDESTVITYQDIEFDVPIPERFFSIQNLKKKRL